MGSGINRIIIVVVSNDSRSPIHSGTKTVSNVVPIAIAIVIAAPVVVAVAIVVAVSIIVISIAVVTLTHLSHTREDGIEDRVEQSRFRRWRVHN